MPYSPNFREHSFLLANVYVEDGSLRLSADQAERVAKLRFRVIVEAMADLVSRVPGAKHITDTHSGHYIHQERPRLVIHSVREVVGAARKKAWTLEFENHGQCVKASKHGNHGRRMPPYQISRRST